MNPNLHSIRNILNAAERAGATIPATVTTAVDNWAAAAAAADALQPEQISDLAEQITNATPKTIGKIVETAATRSITHERARDLVLATQGHVVHHITRELRDSAGAELIASLRPTFDKAAQAIVDCGFSPDTAKQPARIIELGPDAITAWRQLPAHADVLTRIYRDVLVSLTSQLDLLPEAQDARPGARYIALVIDGNHNADIVKAAEVFNSAAGRGEPGEGWHRLVTGGFNLRLNTPAEAVELIEKWNAGKADESVRREARNADATAAYRQRLAGAR